jgi:CheY-like chemotaxis protein
MKRILLIEDELEQRELFKTMLEKAGYEVLVAPNGKIGIQLFHQQPCDLIITDIFMPQEDGIETVIDLKKQRAKVKILAISGGGRWSPYGPHVRADEPLEIARKVGADQILKKPIKIQHLLETVNDLLNNE